MEENNNTNQQEQQNTPAPQEEAKPAVEIKETKEPEIDIDKEIEAVNKKPKNELASIKGWLMFLSVVFTVSMLSGLYIIFYGGKPAPAQKVTVEEEKEGVASSLLKLSVKDEGVALIKVRGVIQESNDSGWGSSPSASNTAKRIRALAEKKEIKGLLLDINSPGGTVAAVQDIYEALLYFKSKGKPVVALFRDVSASGGFYIAMAADKIVAQPGTITGSIGVIMQGSNFEGLFDKLGIKFIPIKSGKHKDIGASYREMTEEEKILLQEMINDTYQQFYNVVKTGRGNVDDATLQLYTDGRVFTGSRAKAIGLIDELGGEEKAKEILSDLTGIKNVKILTTKPSTFMDFLALSAALDSKLSLNNKIEEISSPRVAYLWSY